MSPPAHAPAQEVRRRAFVVLAPDPITAGIAERRITRLLDLHLGPAPRPRVRVLPRWRLAPRRRAERVLRRPPAVLVVHADLPWWSERLALEPQGLSPIYIRPGLLAVREALGRIWSGADAAAWDALIGLDRRLSQLPVVPMEAVHAGGEALHLALAPALGLDPAEHPPEPSRVEAASYVAALSSLTPPRALAADVAGRRLPEGPLPVRLDGAGTAFLGAGWRGAEPDAVFSADRRAFVTAPCGPAPRRLKLGGYMLAHPRRRTRAEAWLDGRVLALLEADPGVQQGFDLDLPLPATARKGLHRVELRLDGLVRPDELGAVGDLRTLALAMQRVEFTESPAGRPAAAPPEIAGARPPAADFASDPLLRETVEDLRPRLALVLGASRPACADAAAVCGVTGGEVMVLAADEGDLSAELARLAARLEGENRRLDLAVLADAPAFEPWFAAAAGADEGSQRLADAALVLAAQDVVGLPGAFYAYDPLRPALVEVSAFAVARRP